MTKNTGFKKAPPLSGACKEGWLDIASDEGLANSYRSVRELNLARARELVKRGYRIHIEINTSPLDNIHLKEGAGIRIYKTVTETKEI